jgi:hypothetical protein
MGRTEQNQPWKPSDRASASRLNAMRDDIIALTRSPLVRGIMDPTGRYEAAGGVAASGGGRIRRQYISGDIAIGFNAPVLMVMMVGSGGGGHSGNSPVAIQGLLYRGGYGGGGGGAGGGGIFFVRDVVATDIFTFTRGEPGGISGGAADSTLLLNGDPALLNAVADGGVGGDGIAGGTGGWFEVSGSRIVDIGFGSSTNGGRYFGLARQNGHHGNPGEVALSVNLSSTQKGMGGRGGQHELSGGWTLDGTGLSPEIDGGGGDGGNGGTGGGLGNQPTDGSPGRGGFVLFLG